MESLGWGLEGHGRELSEDSWKAWAYCSKWWEPGKSCQQGTIMVGTWLQVSRTRYLHTGGLLTRDVHVNKNEGIFENPHTGRALQLFSGSVP